MSNNLGLNGGVQRCPFCSAPTVTDPQQARFRVSCARCGLRYELTGAAYRRTKELPVTLLTQIRAENARGRVPCISMPDIEACGARPARPV